MCVPSQRYGWDIECFQVLPVNFERGNNISTITTWYWGEKRLDNQYLLDHKNTSMHFLPIYASRRARRSVIYLWQYIFRYANFKLYSHSAFHQYPLGISSHICHFQAAQTEMRVILHNIPYSFLRSPMPLQQPYPHHPQNPRY